MGPHTIQDFSKMHLKPSEMVWRTGMDAWEKASDMEELKVALFNNYRQPLSASA